MSSVTDISIANAALMKVGANVIHNFDLDTREARICKERTLPVIRYILDTHPWKAALHRVHLSPVSTPPNFGFEKAFQVPSDSMAIRMVADKNHNAVREYRVEGGQILCDEPEIFLLYSRDISTSGSIPHYLAEVMSFYLAMEISWPLTEKDRPDLPQRYAEALLRAKTQDSRTGAPKYYMGPANSRWIQSR
jgi:hypothetical protein